jgi:hypothetical protein
MDHVRLLYVDTDIGTRLLEEAGYLSITFFKVELLSIKKFVKNNKLLKLPIQDVQDVVLEKFRQKILVHKLSYGQATTRNQLL